MSKVRPAASPTNLLRAPISVLFVRGSLTGSSSPGAGNTGATSSFVPGAYECNSVVSGVVTYEGRQDHVLNEGATGTLTLTANGSSLRAVYSGDTQGSGTLDFTLTSDRSANLVPEQTFDVSRVGLDATTYHESNAPTVTQVNAGTDDDGQHRALLDLPRQRAERDVRRPDVGHGDAVHGEGALATARFMWTKESCPRFRFHRPSPLLETTSLRGLLPALTTDCHRPHPT